MATWDKVKVGDFLFERQGRYKPDAKEINGLQRIHKIDFSGNFHIANKPSKTDMILIKPGDLVISGINVAKGALCVYHGQEDVIATIHYSSYTFDEKQVIVEYFKRFLKSPLFNQLLKEQVKGGIKTEIKPKHLLPLEILLPNKQEQLSILSRFQRIENEDRELKSELTHQQTLLKKLRQQILQEAIEGKLTADWRAQNPNVEPASELLKRIAAEKAQLLKNKKIKKQKPLPPITDEEKPFELPQGWEWCRLGETLDFLTDYHANGAYKKLKENVQLLDKPNFAIMLRTTNFHEKSRFKYKYITKAAFEFLSKSKVYPGDVIMNKIADPGAVFFVDDRKQPMSLAMNLFLLRFNKETVSSKYAYFYLRSNYEYVVSFSSGTATPTITKDAVNVLRFPLPPLTEQLKIVTKVEKLLAICNQLETQISQNQNHAEQLMQAVLKAAFSHNHEAEPVVEQPSTAANEPG